MKVYIASDHAGQELKLRILKEYDFIDLHPDNNPADDYPPIAHDLAVKVVNENTKGILICGSGQGMVMAANKIRGARAALCYDTLSARISREHNDANILCLGGRLLSYRKAKNIINTFLSTKALRHKRHKRRREEIDP